MTYSLARLRVDQPRPPFTLGAEFAGDPDRAFLRDAAGVIELRGDARLFADARDGDVVEVTVRSLDDEGAVITTLRILQAARSGFHLPHRPRAARFAAFVNAVRTYFRARGLDEVFTPTIVTCPGLEPSLEPFRAGQHFLPTSPEINLKKALASGWTDIFEIKSCFRAGENSPHHAAEFFMLEWYRAFADLDLIEADLRGLIAHLCGEGFGVPPNIIATDFQTLYREVFNFELTPRTTVDDLRAVAVEQGVETAADDTFADVFNRLMVDRLEAELARRGAVIVRRFPPSMAALAKLDADGWGDRMEFYWRGLEIANAFNEVTDADEQVRRWADDGRERARLGTSALPTDPDLISALRAGSPPAGGIALGVERLFMAMTETARIAELRLFE